MRHRIPIQGWPTKLLAPTSKLPLLPMLGWIVPPPKRPAWPPASPANAPPLWATMRPGLQQRPLGEPLNCPPPIQTVAKPAAPHPKPPHRWPNFPVQRPPLHRAPPRFHRRQIQSKSLDHPPRRGRSLESARPRILPEPPQAPPPHRPWAQRPAQIGPTPPPHAPAVPPALPPRVEAAGPIATVAAPPNPRAIRTAACATTSPRLLPKRPGPPQKSGPPLPPSNWPALDLRPKRSAGHPDAPPNSPAMPPILLLR